MDLRKKVSLAFTVYQRNQQASPIILFFLIHVFFGKVSAKNQTSHFSKAMKNSPIFSCVTVFHFFSSTGLTYSFNYSNSIIYRVQNKEQRASQGEKIC